LIYNPIYTKKTTTLIIIPAILLGISLLSGVDFTASASETNKYLQPPTTLNLQFARQNSDIYPALYAKSGILEAISWKITIEVNSDGSFKKIIPIPNKNFSADRFADGAPEDGTFTLTGTYNKGNISSEWTFDLHIPPRKDWNYPDTYTGSGTFYSTQPVSEESGAGVIEGNLSRTYTKWTDVKMKDHTTLTENTNIRNTWFAVNTCKEVICGCADMPEATDSKARFNSLTNEVSFAHCTKSDKAQDWTPAIPKTKLFVNDHILTGIDSFATLQFGDMTTFQMKPDTEVIVKSPPEQESKLGLVSGHLWINFKKMLTNGTMEVEMGQAVAGIKGTTLVLEQNNGVSTLKVIEGTVSFTSKETGKSVEVNTGEKVTADSKGLSNIEKFDVAAENSGWKAVDQTKNPKGQAGISIAVYILGAVLFAGGLIFLVLKKKLTKK
jgi:hypothetical protein